MSTAEIRNMKRVWGRLDRAGEGKLETSIPVAGSKAKKKEMNTQIPGVLNKQMLWDCHHPKVPAYF